MPITNHVGVTLERNRPIPDDIAAAAAAADPTGLDASNTGHVEHLRTAAVAWLADRGYDLPPAAYEYIENDTTAVAADDWVVFRAAVAGQFRQFQGQLTNYNGEQVIAAYNPRSDEWHTVAKPLATIVDILDEAPAGYPPRPARYA